VGEFLKKCAAPCGFSAVGGPGPDSEICPTLAWENGAKSLHAGKMIVFQTFGKSRNMYGTGKVAPLVCAQN